MSHLCICGWESGDRTPETILGGITGCLSIVSSVVMTGRFAGRVNCAASETGYFVMQSFDASEGNLNNFSASGLYFRGYIRVAQRPDTHLKTANILTVSDSNLAPKFYLNMVADSNLVAHDYLQQTIATGTILLGKTDNVYANSWRRLECFVGTGASAEWKVLVDGVPSMSGTNNLSTLPAVRLQLGKSYIGDAEPVDIYWDDVSIRNDRFPGPGRCVMLHPVMTGTYMNWTSVGGANDATKIASVSGAPHDDDTDYIQTSTNNFPDTYFCTRTTQAGVGNNINCIKMISVVRKNSSPACACRQRIVYSGTVFDPTNTSQTNAYLLRGVIYDNNPSGDRPWVPSMVDALEIGVVHSTAALRVLRCTQLGIMVDFSGVDHDPHCDIYHICNMTANGRMDAGGTAQLPNISDMTSVGKGSFGGTSNIDLKGDLFLSARTNYGGISSLDNTSNMQSVGGVNFGGTTTQFGLSDLLANGQTTSLIEGQAVLYAISYLLANGGVTYSGSSVIDMLSELKSTGGINFAGTSTSPLITALNSIGAVNFGGTTSIDQILSIVANGTTGSNLAGVASLAILSHLIATGGVNYGTTSQLSILSHLNSNGGLGVGGISTLYGITNQISMANVNFAGISQLANVTDISSAGGVNFASLSSIDMLSAIKSAAGLIATSAAILPISSATRLDRADVNYAGISTLDGVTNISSIGGASFGGVSQLDSTSNFNSIASINFGGIVSAPIISDLIAQVSGFVLGNASIQILSHLIASGRVSFGDSVSLRGDSGINASSNVNMSGNSVLNILTGLLGITGTTLQGSAILSTVSNIIAASQLNVGGIAQFHNVSVLNSVGGIDFGGSAELKNIFDIISVGKVDMGGVAKLSNQLTLNSVGGVNFSSGQVGLYSIVNLIPNGGLQVGAQAVMIGNTIVIGTLEQITQIVNNYQVVISKVLRFTPTPDTTTLVAQPTVNTKILRLES